MTRPPNSVINVGLPSKAFGNGVAMTVIRGFIIVVVSAIGFGAAGGGIGYLLGVLVPEYYRGVFKAGNNPVRIMAEFNPRDVGLGLGLAQGLLAGLLVGSIIVLAVALYATRTREGAKDELTRQVT